MPLHFSILMKHMTSRSLQPRGSEHRETLLSFRATLVVALLLLRADAVRKPGDHKGRPYTGQYWDKDPQINAAVADVFD
jgi:hypothetical protein